MHFHVFSNCSVLQLTKNNVVLWLAALLVLFDSFELSYLLSSSVTYKCCHWRTFYYSLWLESSSTDNCVTLSFTSIQIPFQAHCSEKLFVLPVDPRNSSTDAPPLFILLPFSPVFFILPINTYVMFCIITTCQPLLGLTGCLRTQLSLAHCSEHSNRTVQACYVVAVTVLKGRIMCPLILHEGIVSWKLSLGLWIVVHVILEVLYLPHQFIDSGHFVHIIV